MSRRKSGKAAKDQESEVSMEKTAFRQGHLPSVRPGWE